MTPCAVSSEALPACLRLENPNRLVSLLEMLRAYAERFVRASHYMSAIGWTAVQAAQGNEVQKSQLTREAKSGRLTKIVTDLKADCELGRQPSRPSSTLPPRLQAQSGRLEFPFPPNAL